MSTQTLDVLAMLRSRFSACRDGDFSNGLFLYPADAKRIHDAVANLIDTASAFERSIRSHFSDDAATGQAALRAALAQVGCEASGTPAAPAARDAADASEANAERQGSVPDEAVERVGAHLYVYWDRVTDRARDAYRAKVREALAAVWPHPQRAQRPGGAASTDPRSNG